MTHRGGPLIAVAAAVALLCAGCSSDSGGAGKGGGRSSSTTGRPEAVSTTTPPELDTTTTEDRVLATTTTKPPQDGLVDGDPILKADATGLEAAEVGPPFDTFMGHGMLTRDQVRTNLGEPGTVRVWPAEVVQLGFEGATPMLTGDEAADFVTDATLGRGDPLDCWDDGDAPPIERLGGAAFGSPSDSLIQQVQQFRTEADAQRYFGTFFDPAPLAADPTTPRLVYTLGDDAAQKGLYSTAGCGPASTLDDTCEKLQSCLIQESDAGTVMAARKGQWIIQLQAIGSTASKVEQLMETSLAQLK